MDNAQTAKIIKDTCKKQKISMSKLLDDCNIRKSLIYDLEKRDYTPSSAVIEQIADYLDCSVDYLLGRTDQPNITQKYNNNNISNSNNIAFGENSTVSIKANSEESKNEIIEEISNIVSNLNLRDRSELLTMIYKFMDKHKNKE